jgi:membrane protease YdiL (CAAX protease family)
MIIQHSSKTASKWYYAFGHIVLFCACCAIILVLCSGITQNIPVISDHISILSAAILTFILILLFLKWEKLKLNDIGIVPGKYSISRFLSGYAIGFCMAVSQALVVLAFGHLQLKFVSQISLIDVILPLILYFLIACREELAFRSYPLRTLNISVGPALALTIMTIIFILEHVAGGMTWKMAILGSGIGAILFGISALKTKGIALSVGLHSAWNFGQWTFGFKNKPGIWEAVVEKGYESKVEDVGLLAFVFIMGIAIAGICFYYRKNHLGE